MLEDREYYKQQCLNKAQEQRKNKENEGNVKNSWTFFKIKEVEKALNEQFIRNQMEE